MTATACAWIAERTVFARPDGTYSTIARCSLHPGPEGRPYHRSLVDGLKWRDLKRTGLIPRGTNGDQVRHDGGGV